MPSASSSGAPFGNRASGKLVDEIRFADLDKTTGGKYSRVSFVRRAW
jgi:hypothetical protein